jgi:hypothetical protein
MALIDISSRKQLFVDDDLIESTTHCAAALNRAEKVADNPVLWPEHPWEGGDVSVASVRWDDDAGHFEMRYRATRFVARHGRDEVVVEGEGDGRTCLAVSADGIHWEKPIVGEVEFEGSKQNNILPRHWLMDYTFPDPQADDPARRFRGHVRTGDTTSPGMTFDLYFSPDFRTWTPYADNPVIDTSPRIGRWGPTAFMGWDPIRQVYAAHMENCRHRRAPLDKRLIGRSESPDGIAWSEPETILLPDGQDPPDTEFYHMPCIAYEGVYVGLLWIFRTTNTTHHPEVVFSRDGIRYRRDYRQPFIDRGGGIDFDSVSLYASEPIVHDDRILTFYTGRNWRSPETLLDLGERARGAIGLAVSRRDGFVSVDGTKGLAGNRPIGRPHVVAYSELVTRSFSFTGSQLHLNLEGARQQWGAGPCEVRVEILEPNHAYIPGYEFDDADPIAAGGLDCVASWRGSADLSRLEGKSVKLRFYFRNAKLYSYQFR